MKTSLPPVDGLPAERDNLAEADIAFLNLAAAQGLPGTDDIIVDDCLDMLDDWARRVQIEILRHLYRFELESQAPADTFHVGNSLGRFFCWYMLQVLQEDCGVVYHPNRKFDRSSKIFEKA